MIQYVWYYIIYTTFYCWQDLDILQFSQFQRFCEPYIVSQEETDLGMGLAWKLLWQFTTSTAQPQGRVCLLFLHCLWVISKSFPNPDFKSDTNRWLSRCCDFIKLKDNHKDWFLKMVPTFLSDLAVIILGIMARLLIIFSCRLSVVLWQIAFVVGPQIIYWPTFKACLCLTATLAISQGANNNKFQFISSLDASTTHICPYGS